MKLYKRSVNKLIMLFILTCSINLYSNQYELSICAIFKNEARILKEWIEFHRIQGVEHFYLYNNLSDDDFEKILTPYLNSNIVTLVDWNQSYKTADKKDEIPEWLMVQNSAYNDCLLTYGSDNKWIAFIDLDEFLFCPNTEKLTNFLIDYDRYAGLVVNWLNFGTSFIKELPEQELFTKNFIYCSDQSSWRDFSVKSIVQPKKITNCLSAHHFFPKEGFEIVDVKKHCHPSGIRANEINIDQIRINHYWTRDEKFFNMKKIPNRQKRRSFQTKEILKSFTENLNKKIDLEITKFIPELENRMKIDDPKDF